MKRKKFFRFVHKIIRLGYATGIPLIAFALFFHQPIIGAYTENPGIVQLAWAPFLVMLLNYFFALPGYVYLNATTGTGSDTDGIHFSGDNYDCLSVLLMGIRFL